MWYFRALHAHAHRLLASGLYGRVSPRVLDAGCGTGGLILQLRKREAGWRFTGIDFSALACSLAAERCGSDVEIREASITALPFADASFDAIVSADVLVQVDERAKALREFYRCLKPGGVVVLNVAAYKWMWSYHDDTCQTKHRYSRRELRAELMGSGFQSVRATHWNALPFPLLVLKRKVFRMRGDTSDVRLFPPPIEAAFNAAMTLERVWLRTAGGIPFGSSILALGRRSE